MKHTTFHPLSSFKPTQSKGPCLNTFYRMVYSELLLMCKEEQLPYKNHNLTHSQSSALNLLKTNEKIIKPADKGGSIALQDKADYIKEGTRLLGDSQTYVKLSNDSLPVFTTEAIVLVYQALIDNVITKNEASFLVQKCHHTFTIYPKYTNFQPIPQVGP